jgi:SNF2 family DNA or RNA helicase
VSSQDRKALADKFNKEDFKLRVMLVSTKAGNMGINLVVGVCLR